jgi:heat shock protein HtpX
MNAFSVGTRNNPIIGITGGLLNVLSINELAGVLAHEISHIRHNDMRVMGFADMISRLTSILSTAGQILLFVNLPLILFGIATVSWLGILFLIVAPVLSGLLQLAISRTREFDADLEAVRLTGDPDGLASALQKIETYRVSFWDRVFMPGRHMPDPSVFRTHPDTGERIERILSLRKPERPVLDYPMFDQFIPPEHLSAMVRRPRRYISGLWY